MPGDGKGLELQLAVHRLRRLHGISIGFEHLHLVPQSDPTDGPMLLQGIASTPDIDMQRMKIRGWAFGFPLPKYCRDVPLLYKHDLKQIAGCIEQLEYDDRGGLRVRARVDHQRARRCNAFSIAGSVTSYQIINPERPDFFAVIDGIHLDEISLTDIPANPHCRVLRRYPACALTSQYDQLLQRVASLQATLTQLQTTTGVRT